MALFESDIHNKNLVLDIKTKKNKRHKYMKNELYPPHLNNINMLIQHWK